MSSFLIFYPVFCVFSFFSSILFRFCFCSGKEDPKDIAYCAGELGLPLYNFVCFQYFVLFFFVYFVLFFVFFELWVVLR